MDYSATRNIARDAPTSSHESHPLTWSPQESFHATAYAWEFVVKLRAETRIFAVPCGMFGQTTCSTLFLRLRPVLPARLWVSILTVRSRSFCSIGPGGSVHTREILRVALAWKLSWGDQAGVGTRERMLVILEQYSSLHYISWVFCFRLCWRMLDCSVFIFCWTMTCERSEVTESLEVHDAGHTPFFDI